MSQKSQGQQADHWSTQFGSIHTMLVILACLWLTACSQQTVPEMDNPSIESNTSQPSGPPSVLTLESLLQRWVLVSVNASPIVVESDGDREVWIEFGPPCYETGDGHCNEAFDGGWEPSEEQRGRLSLRGYSGCNWFGSEAKLEDERLIAKPITSTQRGCGNAESQEAKINKLLAEKPLLSVQDHKLEIVSVTGDRIVAVLSAP